MEVYDEQIDALVAEHIMGWKPHILNGKCYRGNEGYIYDGCVWNPSEDGNHMNEAVKRFYAENRDTVQSVAIWYDEEGYEATIHGVEEDSGCGCCFETPTLSVVTDESMEVAVCVAMLETVLGEKIELKPIRGTS